MTEQVVVLQRFLQSEVCDCPVRNQSLRLLLGTPRDKNKITLQLIVQDLIAPIFILSSPDNTERKFIGEQTGTIKILNSNGVLLKKPFLDLRPLMTPLLKAFDERGLLSLAFHPKFIKNGLIYINYSSKRRKNSPFNGPTAYTWKTSEFKVSK